MALLEMYLPSLLAEQHLLEHRQDLLEQYHVHSLGAACRS
jgi:hypothetical protein